MAHILWLTPKRFCITKLNIAKTKVNFLNDCFQITMRVATFVRSGYHKKRESESEHTRDVLSVHRQPKLVPLVMNFLLPIYKSYRNHKIWNYIVVHSQNDDAQNGKRNK